MAIREIAVFTWQRTPWWAWCIPWLALWPLRWYVERYADQWERRALEGKEVARDRWLRAYGQPIDGPNRTKEEA